MFLLLVLAGLLTSTLLAYGAGPLHTAEDVRVWQQRSTQGPYRVAGDHQPQSPGDWERITQQAEAFRANPEGDRYLGRTTCPHTEADGPFNGSWHRGSKLRDAAFVALVQDDAALRKAVLTELHTHATAPGLQWSNSTLFGCPEFIGGTTMPWNSVFVKYVIGYSFVREQAPDAQRATLDAWFLAYGQRMEWSVHETVKKRFPQRKQEDYTLSSSYSTCQSPKALYVQSSPYQTCAFHNAWTNQTALSALAVGLTGVLLQDGALQAEATRFFQEWVRYMVWPDGTEGETDRWVNGAPQHGMSYAGLGIIQMTLLAEVFSRAGDARLYDYTATDGLHSSQVTHEGTTKSLKATITEYISRVRETRSIYADSKADATRLDSNMADCCQWHTVNDVIMAALVSRAHPTVTPAVLRAGGPPYASTVQSNCGSGGPTSLAWATGDAWCVLPGVMFMYANRTEPPLPPATAMVVQSITCVDNVPLITFRPGPATGSWSSAGPCCDTGPAPCCDTGAPPSAP